MFSVACSSKNDEKKTFKHLESVGRAIFRKTKNKHTRKKNCNSLKITATQWKMELVILRMMRRVFKYVCKCIGHSPDCIKIVRYCDRSTEFFTPSFSFFTSEIFYFNFGIVLVPTFLERKFFLSAAFNLFSSKNIFKLFFHFQVLLNPNHHVRRWRIYVSHFNLI